MQQIERPTQPKQRLNTVDNIDPSSFQRPRTISDPNQKSHHALHKSLDDFKHFGNYTDFQVDIQRESLRENLDGKMGESLCKTTAWISWWGFVLIYFHIAMLLAWNIGCVLEEVDSSYEVAGKLGGALTGLTVPLAVYLIVLHLINFVEPKQQSQIVRIIFLVPVYSITAYISLLKPQWSLQITTVRECYEAYVIYCFLQFLICQIESGEGNSENFTFSGHKPPFCCLQPWGAGPQFLYNCKQGVFQYVLIRLFSTVIALIFQVVQSSEQKEEFNIGTLMVDSIIFCSQMWALYVLLLFYNATHKEMGHLHPMGKFLAIKGVVFFSWWQGVLVEFLEHKGHIGNIGRYSANHVAQGIQDLLICAEMLIAAIVFFFTFPVSDFIHRYQSPPISLRKRNKNDSDQEKEYNSGPKKPNMKYIRSSAHHSANREHHHIETKIYLPAVRVPTSFSYALWASAVPIELHSDVQNFCKKLFESLKFGNKWHFLTKKKVECSSKKFNVLRPSNNSSLLVL